MGDLGVEGGQGSAGVLLPNVLAELERRGRVKIADHHAISGIGHNTQQLAGPAENQIPAGGIEFAKQSFEDIAVQLECSGRFRICTRRNSFPVSRSSGLELGLQSPSMSVERG